MGFMTKMRREAREGRAVGRGLPAVRQPGLPGPTTYGASLPREGMRLIDKIRWSLARHALRRHSLSDPRALPVREGDPALQSKAGRRLFHRRPSIEAGDGRRNMDAATVVLARPDSARTSTAGNSCFSSSGPSVPGAAGLNLSSREREHAILGIRTESSSGGFQVDE